MNEADKAFLDSLRNDAVDSLMQLPPSQLASQLKMSMQIRERYVEQLQTVMRENALYREFLAGLGYDPDAPEFHVPATPPYLEQLAPLPADTTAAADSYPDFDDPEVVPVGLEERHE